PLPVSEPTPAPIAPTKPSPAGGGFRETLWFKKGEVEQFIAQKAAAEKEEGAPSPEAPAEDIRPLEDRYVDDGSVSAEDRENFSPGTGRTVFGMRDGPPAPARAIPGERMSAEDMIAEIHTGRRIGVYIAIGIGVLVLIVLGWLVMGRSRGSPRTAV